MIVPLDWDSAHFGFPVARVEPGSLSLHELESDLSEAAKAGTRLVYCLRPADLRIPETTLVRLGGRALTTSVLYRKDLTIGRQEPREDVAIEALPRARLSDELRRLAPLCGRYSRFHLDPEIGEEAFVRLYEIWLERSAMGELAEQVLVARDEDGNALGFAALARPDPATCRMTLLAVAEAARGRGIGGALATAAEAATEAGGGRRVELTAQLENAAARSLFESTGYEIAGAAERAHHFWLEPAR